VVFIQHVRLAGDWLLMLICCDKKNTAGWLLVAGLFREKCIVGWWLISETDMLIN
jgi:hypothetical protein